MSTESKLQAEIVRHLRSKGCYVIKTRPGVGVPTGCPDVVFMIEGFWGAIEVKAGPKDPYQPLQRQTLDKMDKWSWAKRVDTSNWIEVREELEAIL